MKKYVFTNLSSLQKNYNYAIAIVLSLGLLYGFTESIAICNAVTILGAAIYGRFNLVDNVGMTRLVKKNLYNIIKNNNFYREENGEVTYKPEVYYDCTDKGIEIRIRLDGSAISEKYLELERSLENLFVMDCISKEEAEGYIIYTLDRAPAERLSIDTVKELQNDLIPINSKIAWNFRKCPHALISGITGKGKTFFLAYLIRMFTLLQADIKILDPKISDLSYLERILADNVVSSPGQIAKILREAKEEINARFETFKHLPAYGFGKDYKDYGFKPIVILFDEMAAFVASVDKKAAAEIEGYMLEIIMKGRQAGVFMILTTQRPDADVIKTAIRDQLGLRVALGEMSKTGYSMVFGSDFKDLELNCSAPGNGFIYIDGVHTKPIKFQSPLFKRDYNFVRDIKNLRRLG